MAYAGHVLRESFSSENNVLLIMEGKVNGVKTRDWSRRTWIDDNKE